MDIKDKLTDQQKQEIQDLIIECQVLENLLKKHRVSLLEKVNQAIKMLGLSPKLYNLKVNPEQNIWVAELKADSLVLPNKETRQGIQLN